MSRSAASLRPPGLGKGGTIAVSGRNAKLNHATLAASSAGGQGGSVTVTGTNAVSLASTAVDASGATGGGAIRIGGDFHGASDLTSAQTTTIDSASTLNASATGSGNGGTVAVWSNGTTSFAGQITATGGAGGGAGGYAEVSANPVDPRRARLSRRRRSDRRQGNGRDVAARPFRHRHFDRDEFRRLVFRRQSEHWNPTATSVINNVTLENQLANSNVIVSTGLAGSPGSDAGNLTVSAPISWSSNNSLTLTAANTISINASINSSLAGRLTLNAGGNIIENINAAIVASAVSAISTSTNGKVVLTSAPTLGNFTGNAVNSISGSAPAGFSFTDTASMSVAGISASAGSTYLQSSGSITQTGPIRGAALFADAVFNVSLTNPNNSVGILAGGAGVISDVSGAFQFTNNNGTNLTIGTVNYFVSNSIGSATLTSASGVSAAGSIDISNVGNLVVNSPVQNPSTFSTFGPIVLAATGAFTNNVGPSAIVNPGGIWQVFSATPSGDAFNGLNSGNTAVWNTTFGQPVTAAGDRYIFAFQPTITVTSTNDSKTYGQDVTARVATDFVVSGLQPGVAGAYLPDTAAAVYSGTPLVTSLGSPARASVSGSPYPITVAPGHLRRL